MIVCVRKSRDEASSHLGRVKSTRSLRRVLAGPMQSGSNTYRRLRYRPLLGGS